MDAPTNSIIRGLVLVLAIDVVDDVTGGRAIGHALVGWRVVVIAILCIVGLAVEIGGMIVINVALRTVAVVRGLERSNQGPCLGARVVQ